MPRLCIIILFATLVVVITNATPVSWYPATANFANPLPSTRNISTSTTNLSKIWAYYPNFSWSSNFTGDCASVTISPSSGSSVSRASVEIQIDWAVLKTVAVKYCYIHATTSTGESALLQIRIETSSFYCNYQPDPVQFCRKVLSENNGNVKCDYTGSCVQHEEDEPHAQGLGSLTLAIIIVASLIGAALIWIVIAVLVRECKAKRQKVYVDSYQLMNPVENK